MVTRRRLWASIALVVGTILTVVSPVRADNPIVQHIYTADPAPLVHNGRVYLYTGHDEDGSTWFTMKEWRVFSSADMVNWTDHGSPMSLATFSWAKQDAWAGQAIERNGKFYWYVPVVNRATGRMSIGVGANWVSPFGPLRIDIAKAILKQEGDDTKLFSFNVGTSF